MVQTLAERAVSDLVVVLETEYEGARRLVCDAVPARTLLVPRALTLVEETSRDRRRDLAGRAVVVDVVARVLAGKTGVDSMVEVVCPDPVQSESPENRRPDQSHVVAAVFRDDENLPI